MRQNDEIQLSNDSVEWLDALYLLIRPTYSCAGALTYLLTYSLLGAHKTGDISETVEDKAKAESYY